MDSERWKKIEDIFQDALDLSGGEREKFIREKADGDAELRAEVEKLIARFETEEEFLESPVWTDSAILGNTLKSRVASSLEKEILPVSAEKSFIGKKIGVYRLTEQIGRGGMGVVYAAERADGEFYQKTAVKLIKRGMDTDFIVSRFRHERQILANLNHPNIARLLDGGTTDDDLPFFVMEFIEGEPFLKYCEEKDLDLRQKLELFLQVCAPIIYAHRRKIIHRDIKPSNILVNEDGEPKLLDFGIAKLLDADSIHESLLPTATAMRLMTPEYASPEQVRGEEITPASDQYSLGVLLYELITGTRPYKFPSRSPHEIARVICEELPIEPSSGSFVKFTKSEFDFRSDEEFCKNLDRIVLKTLQKNPSERYESVEEFTADIERFLRNENVRAEASVKTSVKSAAETEIEKIHQTGKLVSNKNEHTTVSPAKNASVSPRRKGVKTGIFLILLSFLTLPFLFLLTLAGKFHPAFLLGGFLLFFLGGIIRIIYALLFEPKQIESFTPEKLTEQISEAETKLIHSSAPRETISGNHSTAEKTAETEKSIAVLPFRHLDTMSSETTGSGEFLSVGLADALVTRISSVRQLIVRPTSSVLKFGGGDVDSLEAGKELNVRFIVEGNIVKTEKRIRISVQLLDIENRSTVWAERFDEDLIDYLDLEDSISAKVVESLLPKLSGEEQRKLEKRGTNNADAYEAYLRGRYHFNFYTDEGFQKAIEYYEKAVALDPGYALAHAAIADYYVWQSVYDVNPVSPKAKESALKAIALDDQLSEAYAALGLATLYGDYDWKTTEENLLRAIELNPNNSVAHLWYSHCLYTQKRFPEGTRHVSRALDLDPLSYLNHNTFSWSFYFQRRYDEALKLNDELLASYPKISQAHFSRGSFLDKLGRPEKALEAMQTALELEPDSLFVLYGIASALAAAGRREEVENLIEEIKTKSKKRYFSNYQTAIVYCYLNEVDTALEYLEKSCENRDSLLVWLAVEPSLDPVRGDARYQKLLEKINHPLAAQSEIAPPNIFGSPSSSPSSASAETPARTAQTKRGFPRALKYALFAAIALVIGFGVYHVATNLTFDFSNTPPSERWKNNFAAQMNARRLTSSGTAIAAAISPDGKRVAFSGREGDSQSLWIRQTDAPADQPPRRLVAPSADNFVGINFTPDGNAVFYTIYNPDNAQFALRRVAANADTNAEPPQQILSDIGGAVGFAPEGDRAAYFRLDLKAGKMNLLVATLNEDGAADEAAAQIVAERQLPGFFTAHPAFSPDGKKIIFAASSLTDGKETTNLFVADLESKTEEKLGATDFNRLSAIAWRAGGDEIVLSGNRRNTEPQQLLLAAFPSGEITRLTNDLSDYSGASLTRDSAVLVTAKKTRESNVATADLTAGKSVGEIAFKNLTAGSERRDGMRGISWTSDERIVFTAGSGEENTVAVINADGTNRQTFDLGDALPVNPVLTADNRFLFFLDQKEKESALKRYDAANGEIKQMSAGLSLSLALLSDNRFVIFSAVSRASRTSLHRVSIEGGDETELTAAACIRAAASPDGHFIACYYKPEQFAGKWRLAVLNSSGGVPIRFLDPPETANLQNAQERPLAWSADNRWIYYLNDKGGISNIYRIRADGDDGAPEQITEFSTGRIFEFAVAPDGKRIALARGATSSDIVIFKKSQ